jgi:enoyl-[acyl-carrier protein] reductase II
MSTTTNPICQLFQIKFPIIQGGMIWCSGWELASAVSNAGGLGLIGAGSMYPEILEQQIKKCKAATYKPYGVNLPLLYPNIEQHIQTIIKHQVPIVFTSAGNPNTWTKILQDAGIKVVHVVASVKFAQKAEAAGVDAIVAEGFEAGGHNGRDETTTLCLIPMVRKAVQIPIIAAGGIGTGEGMLAVMNLGADGIQMGSRFVVAQESSAHQNFKNAVIEAQDGATLLTLKELTPVRLLKNPFFEKVQQAYESGATTSQLQELLGRGRAKKGMFEGDLSEGELEIGQVAGLFDQILSAREIIEQMISAYNIALTKQQPL